MRYINPRLRFVTSSDKQKIAARAWNNPNVTDIVYGGAKGGGKSYLGAALIFADALTYDGTRYFIARKQLNDLRKHTIPTIERVFADWNKVELHKQYGPVLTDEQSQQVLISLSKLAKFNGMDNSYHLNNGSTVLLIDAKYWPRDPLYERFGSMLMTRGWIEEAGEFEVSAMTNLSISIGRWMNDKYEKYGLNGKLLQTCNPKKNYLYKEYYLPWKSGCLPEDKVFIQAFAHENTQNEAGYISRLDAKLKGVERQRLLLGDWEYSESADSLIEYDKILDIFTNEGLQGGLKKITSDIARLGGDRIVKIEWDGWRGKVTELPKGKLNETAAFLEAARLRLGLGKSDVLIDSDGMGVGINDFVGYKMFINNSAPLPDPLQPFNSEGKEQREQYDNLKSQCYFRLADRINKNGLYLECESEEQQQLIIEELEQVRIKKLDSDSKKGVVPKDKVKEAIGRSPDFADCFISGTKILTPKGERNIEDVKKGDYVVTPNGNRKIIEIIKKKTSVIHNINNEIFCTSNHRFISNKGVISADTLMINDYLYKVSINHLWAWRLKKLFITKAKNIGFLEQILNITMPILRSKENDQKLDYINKCSLMNTDQYRKDTTFIILMKTLSITFLLIWLQLKKVNTEAIIRQSGWLIRFAYQKVLIPLENILIKLKNGISLTRVKSGIVKMALNPGLTGNRLHYNVNTASINLKHLEQMRNTVLTNVIKTSDIKKRKDLKQEFAHNVKENLVCVNMKNQSAVTVNVPVYLNEPVDVYTLTVEKDHVYYANGYLVENCIMMKELYELKPIRIFSDAEY